MYCLRVIVLFCICTAFNGSSGLPRNWRSLLSPSALSKLDNDAGDERFDSNLFEGDIVGVDPNSEPTNLAKQIKNVANDERLRWPNGIVPYTLSQSFTERQRDLILGGMKEISDATGGCIRFIVQTTQEDYITILSGLSGCSSEVGRLKGAQSVVYSSNCLDTIGEAQHELLHVLGFYHEQSRSDRDEYVVINWSNIKEEDKRQFAITQNATTFGLPYDPESIMHYPTNAFAISNKFPTIFPKRQKKKGVAYEMGQNVRMSVLDVAKLNMAYDCPVRTDTTTSAILESTEQSDQLIACGKQMRLSTKTMLSLKNDGFLQVSDLSVLDSDNIGKLDLLPRDEFTLLHFIKSGGTCASKLTEETIATTKHKLKARPSTTASTTIRRTTLTSTATTLKTTLKTTNHVQLEITTSKADFPTKEFRSHNLSRSECDSLTLSYCHPGYQCKSTWFRCEGTATPAEERSFLTKLNSILPATPLSFIILSETTLNHATLSGLTDNFVQLQVIGVQNLNCYVMRDIEMPNLLDLIFYNCENITIPRDSFRGLGQLRTLTFRRSTILALEQGAVENLTNLKLVSFDYLMWFYLMWFYEPFLPQWKDHLFRLHCSAEYAWLRKYLRQHPQLIQPKKQGEMFVVPGWGESDSSFHGGIFFPADCSRADLKGTIDQTAFSINVDDD